MKKKRISFGALTFVLTSCFVLSPSHIKTSHAEDIDTERISQEAERNRELLEIWKEHVKTLTKERDDAYSQLERMRAARPAGMAQFGGVETMPLPNAQSAAQIESLQSEVSRLQEELQQRSAVPSGGSSREIQMQLSALQNQYQQAKKELSEAREDKDQAIREKERALSQVDTLSEEIVGLRSGASPSSTDDVSQSLQRALDTQKKRNEELQRQYGELEQEIETLRQKAEQAPRGTRRDDKKIEDLETQLQDLRSENARLKSDLSIGTTVAAAGGSPDREKDAFMRQARELQYQNDTLKAQIEKLQVVEKELVNTRAYFTPIVKDLQEKNDRLNSDIIGLRSENDRFRRESENAVRDLQNVKSQNQQLSKENEQSLAELERLKGQNQKLAADVQAMKTEYQNFESQLATYKSQLQMASADREKYRNAEEEFKKKEEAFKDNSSRITELELALKSQEEHYKQLVATKESQIQQMATQLTGIEKTNKEFQNREMDTMKSAEKYQTALRANLQDMKNLKSNFEAYLESLVASFEERTR